MTMYSSDYATGSGGSSVLKIQNITSDNTVTDWNYCVLVNANSLTSNLVVTLPQSTANSIGKTIVIKKTDSSNNSICIKANNSDTINGSTNYIYLYNKDDCITIMSSENGKCETLPDNRQGTGSGSSYLKARTSAQITVANGAPFIFNTVEGQYGNKISINTTNGQITLKGGSTYKLTASGSYCAVGYWDTSWYMNGIEMVGTKSQAEGASAGSDLTNIIVVSPTNDTVYTYCNSSGGSGAFGSDNAKLYPWVYVEEISRQATIMNTVDYLCVANSSDKTSIGGNSDLICDTIVSGNIPYNTTTGVATLTAGKTYELIGEPSFSLFSDSTNGYVIFDFVDASTNTLLASSNKVSGCSIPINRNTGEMNSISAHLIYTPSTNQTVKLRVTSASGTATFRYIGSKITIKQIGSSGVSNIPDNLLSSNIVTLVGTQTLTNKTLNNPTLVTPNSYYCYLPSTTSNDTLVTTSTSQTLSNKQLLGGACTMIIDNNNSTKKAMFSCSNISSNTTRTYNFPDADGTIALVNTLINQIYPVGHILMTENSANPSTYLGVGTWVSYGAGKVPVGIDTSQTEFNTIGKTGGEKTHTNTIDEIPSHNHTNGNFKYILQSTSVNTLATSDTSAGEPDLINKAEMVSAGGGLPHNNLQPYIVCYMWKRTL